MSVNLNEPISKSMIVEVNEGMRLIINLSERVIMNTSVGINLNECSSMIRYMNVSAYINLLISPSGSKNMNMCVL